MKINFGSVKIYFYSFEKNTEENVLNLCKYMIPPV
jgi:hypothetical protein